MRFLYLIPLAVLTGCILPPPQAPNQSTNIPPNVTFSPGGAVITVNRTLAVVAGKQVQLDFFHAHQNPDCTLDLGLEPTLKISTAAAHGVVSAKQGEDYSNYPVNSVMAKCSATRIPGTIVAYTAPIGYSGPDQFSYELFTTDGREWVSNFVVNVVP